MAGSEQANRWRTSQTLFGRDDELQQLAQMLDGVEGDTRALLLVGEPGIGKSALLAHASAIAKGLGMRVLSTAGVESEAHVPYSGLNQLVRPVLGTAERMADKHRAAIYGALDVSDDDSANPFVVGLATLELVGEVATMSPVVLVIDDAQWVDPSTLDALAVMARRFGDDPIWLLAAIRTGYDTVLHQTGITVHHLERLDEWSSQRLLDQLSPRLDSAIRAETLKLSDGNPLALVELSRSGSEPTGDSLAVSARIERAFAGRLNELPLISRTIVLVASLDNGEDLFEILAAATEIAGTKTTLKHLSHAIAAQLVTLDGSSLRFQHSLVRSAVRQAASVEETVAAHAAFAKVLADNPDRAVWHRAAATVGTDDDLAGELEAAARRIVRRGGTGAAQAALERSAALSTDPLDRANRLLSAAELAFELGRPEAVDRLIQEAEALDGDHVLHARAMWIRERFDDGVPRGTTRVAAIARTALDTARRGDTDLALDLLASAAVKCWWGNPTESERTAVLQSAMEMHVPPDDPRLIAVQAWTSPMNLDHAIIKQLSKMNPDHIHDPAALRMLGAAAICVGDHVTSARFLDASVEGLRRDGKLASLAQSLTLRAWNSLHLAHLDLALADAEDGERLAIEGGQRFWAARAQAARALVAGLRGDAALAEGLTAQAERVAYPSGANAAVADVQVARGMTALSASEYQAAFDHFLRMFDPSDVAFHAMKRYWSVGDLADAAVHAGHRDVALSVLDDLRVALGSTSSPHVQSSMRHATAVLAADASADREYREAIAATSGEFPFERARLQLAYGKWLRRRRRVAESRVPLRSARATFDALGVISWGQQCRDELRASGEATVNRDPDALDKLTPQELQIARLAAEGLPNREIGLRLYLSPRTIGSHLYRIFPKLDVTSRQQLASRLRDMNLQHTGDRDAGYEPRPTT